MHRAQPGNLGASQRQRARQERPKAALSHQCCQWRTKLFQKAKGVRGFGHGRLIFIRLTKDEALGEIPHLSSGAAHWTICLGAPQNGAGADQDSLVLTWRPQSESPRALKGYSKGQFLDIR